ncbi:MAG: transposase, partial [Burkholderiaceae bacterium]|nr:transposase [Burkholderiaceae bacterium]
NLIYADRFFPSSKRCSACGRIHQGLTLKDREWTCVCGQHHERDENAAINLTQYPFLEENSREGRDDPKSVKSSPRVKDVGASALAKEVLQAEVLGSLEASALMIRQG